MKNNKVALNINLNKLFFLLNKKAKVSENNKKYKLFFIITLFLIFSDDLSRTVSSINFIISMKVLFYFVLLLYIRKRS